MNTSFAPRSSWPPPPTRQLAPPGSSFVDEASQMKVVVLENVSMVFHERFESEIEDLSIYDYSVEAPSYLCEKASPRRLDSSEYAANSNISRYMFQMESDTIGRGITNDPNEIGCDQPVRPTLQRDSVLGSLPALLASNIETPSQQPRIDHETYANKLLGICEDDEATSRTTLSVASSQEFQSEDSASEDQKKPIRRWFKLSLKGKKSKKDKKDVKKEKQSLARKAPPKRSVSELRRASF